MSTRDEYEAALAELVAEGKVVKFRGSNGKWKYQAAEQCGATLHGAVCDLPAGHAGLHRPRNHRDLKGGS